MRKKTSFMVCVAALVSLAAAGAHAYDNSWLISFKAVTSTIGTGSPVQLGVGTNIEQNASFPSSTGEGATAERTAELGDTNYHKRHDMERDTDGTEAYAWDLKIGARGAIGTTSNVRICIWNNTLPSYGIGGELNHGLAYGFYKGDVLLRWFSDTGTVKDTAMAADSAFTENLWTNTSSLIKVASNWLPTTADYGFNLQLTLNNATTFAGLEDFRFTAFTPEAGPGPSHVTPEPGSMAALASGLIGFAGFALRRRRA